MRTTISQLTYVDKKRFFGNISKKSFTVAQG